jgi:ATP-binding cassette subfamily C exporter for protease/lipase
VAENVARFNEVKRGAVEAALALVGLTEVVNALEQGMDTRIGEDGAVLSGGQRQRLGLARALYGAPRLLVLDEPNANLDEAGDKGLIELIKHLKTQGMTILVITHRTNLLAAVDNILLLREGVVAAFGPKDDVMQAMRQAAEKQAQQAQQARHAAPNERVLPMPQRPADTPAAGQAGASA